MDCEVYDGWSEDDADVAALRWSLRSYVDGCHWGPAAELIARNRGGGWCRLTPTEARLINRELRRYGLEIEFEDESARSWVVLQAEAA